MVKDQQVRRLVKLKKNEKTLTMAAAKAGMSRKTARKYLKSGKLPSQCQPERYWRTRSDPFESVWPEVKEILKRSSGPNRPLIPIESGHLFRGNPAGDSGAK